MRLIAIGCEYTGVTSLLNALFQRGADRGIDFHIDDHFSIPDRYHLDPQDQAAMVDMSPTLKERFQRMQVVYHIRLMQRYANILLGGFHIEEAIYGPRYYYPGIEIQEDRRFEVEMPNDTILVLLTARRETIEQRMKADPHDFQVVKVDDIPLLLDRFNDQYEASWLKQKFQIDTSDLTPAQLLDAFLDGSVLHLNTADALMRLLEAAGHGVVTPGERSP